MKTPAVLTNAGITNPGACAAVLAAALLARGAEAATIVAHARDGVDVGSGANNPANGNAWGDPDENGPPYFTNAANPVGTVTTTLIADDGTGNVTPARFTYHITDTATGADFTIDQVVYAMAGTVGVPGSYSAYNMRTYSQVDGPADNRNRTEFITSGGGHEYWRTTFDLGSLTVLSGPAVTFASWDQVKFKAIDAGSTGKIVASGTTNDPGAGASLLDFTNADSGATVSLTGGDGISSIDWVPTSGAAAAGFQSQGWVASFEVVPQPSALGLLGVGGLMLMIRRRGRP
jgi:hypothetical protein